MKKVITVGFLIVVLFFAFKPDLFAEEVRLLSVTSEEKAGQLIINFTFDKPTQFISYTLREPPRVILEPIDDTYTDLAGHELNDGLVAGIKIAKIHVERVVSIAVELKKDVPYYLVENKNVVSVYLTPQAEEKSEEVIIKDEILPEEVTDTRSQEQIEQEELRRVQELNKLIAPTRER